MWLAAAYQPTTAFSLRSSATTSSGGRTNLVPTMYAVKVALIDAAYRAGEDGASLFPIVRDVPIRFQPPARAVVTNTFVKILREARAPSPPKATPGEPALEVADDGREGADDGLATYTSSVGFRELCHYAGPLTVAFDLRSLSNAGRERIERLLPVVNYFGKRSSFFQFTAAREVAELDRTYSFVVGEQVGSFPSTIVIQYLDDMGAKATFGAVNTFAADSARIHRDRVLVPIALPYRKVSSSRGYTAYERLGGGQ